MTDDATLALIFARNEFYKRLHYLALSAFALSLIVIIFLFWGVLYLLHNPTQPLYFPTDNVGRLIQVIPVSKPNMTLDDVMAWTIEAVQNSYSYDYINYRSELQDSQKYYTNYGWSKYMGALSSNNNLLALTQRKMIVIAQAVDEPKLLANGILSGAYAWKFELPLLVAYSLPPYDDNSKFYNPLQVTVIVQRQPALKGYKGLGIVQSIGTIVSTPTNNQPQEISATTTGP